MAKVLTDAAIRRLIPRKKPYKVSDSLGLYLLVNPNGARLWRLRYRVGEKQKALALGPYPKPHWRKRGRNGTPPEKCAPMASI